MDDTRQQEAIELCSEILKNIDDRWELDKTLGKCFHLAMVLNDEPASSWFHQELYGYHKGQEQVLRIRGRSCLLGEKEHLVYNSISLIKSEMERLQNWLNRSYSHDIEQQLSVYQFILPRIKELARIWVSKTYSSVKFGSIPQNVFEETRTFVDNKLKELVPEALEKFVSVYDNLSSSKAEDWANAVHSCRRILKNLADKLYPPTDKVIEKIINGKKEKIQLGKDQYVNRLMAFIECKSNSDTYKRIVGSNLEYIGNRLDSVCRAIHKGTHGEISKDEARRYVIYTYLLIGDILSLT